jgi:Na+/H+ antiporter NhaD/arsenite permease-like protein
VPGIPIEFLLFGITLVGVALFHHHTLRVATAGLALISAYTIFVGASPHGPGLSGFVAHLREEWVILANLGGLLTGFALLSNHFQRSHVPLALPRILPPGWPGAFALLAIVFVLSSFLDNIAAALIGGTMARSVFPSVHIGYIAAIVAASNAGGSGSVVGDTTTTMMWIAGISPLDVLHAYAAAVPALVICGIPASLQQIAAAPMLRRPGERPRIDWARLGIVALILAAAVAANVIMNTRFPQYGEALPILGGTVWLVLLLTAPVRQPEWHVLPEALKGTVFLLSLVLAASLMPVEALPRASWPTTMGLGFVSAVFDNIPLTALAIAQGGYDWGALAYAVGFGGSMIWFGSSAGVAITNLFPEARSVFRWLRHGWHVALAYVVGFFVLLGLLGWQPPAPGRGVRTSPASSQEGQP